MPKKNKVPETDWSKYDSMPFAVVMYSGVLGWITFSNPNSPAEAHRSFEACDSQKKMLLNYGQIVTQS